MVGNVENVVKTWEIRTIGSAESSPEKAGVGGSIPSLATILTALKSTFTYGFFRLCQICVMHQPNYPVLSGLEFGSPLGIVPADCGGAVGKDTCYLFNSRALP